MILAKIVGVGKCVPKKIIENAELYGKVKNFEVEKARDSFLKKGEEVADFDDAQIFDLWVQRVTGIKRRPFVSDGEFEKGLEAEDMARQASSIALEEAKLTPKDLDHIIFSTYSNNRLIPSAACKLSDMLGTNCSVRTLNGACSGFLDGLIDATIKVRAGVFKRILVVAAENMSDKMNYDDPKSSIIFSDGAGACVVSAVDEGKRSINLLGFGGGVQYSEQVYMERLSHILFNDGPYVQRNAVQTMYGVMEKAILASKKTFADLSCVIPHQANGRIITALDAKIKNTLSQLSSSDSSKQESEDRSKSFFTVNCIADYGNLSSASVPVAFDDYLKGRFSKDHSNKLDEGKIMVLASVGGGYTYAAIALSE